MKKQRYSYRNRVVLIKDNGDVIKFDKEQDLAKYIGKSLPMISCYLKGKIKPKNYTIMRLADYEKTLVDNIIEEPKDEIIRQTKQDYYINVLVGLANGTLVEGATYEINNQKLVYNKEKQALMIGEYIMFKKETMLETVKIELPLLTEKEINFLKNLLKAFDKVKGIRKCRSNNCDMQFIRIETEFEKDNRDLPDFSNGKYYSNLEENRLYSLDELNL